MGILKNVPLVGLDGKTQLVDLVFLDEEEENQEADSNAAAEGEENRGGERGVFSGIDQKLLSTLLSAATAIRECELQSQELLSPLKRINKPTPPEDLKKKSLDCSSSSSYIPEIAGGKYERGEHSCSNCVICKGKIPTGELIRTRNCKHRFCEDCIVIYIREKIKEEDGIRIKCPESGCKKLLERDFCGRFVPEEVFQRWVVAETEYSVLAEPLYIKCPFEWCGKNFVDDERRYQFRACTSCWRIFCVICRAPCHIGKTCWEYRLGLEVEVELELQRSRRRQRRGGWW